MKSTPLKKACSRYIGDDHQHDQCSREVKHLWCYNVVKKVGNVVFIIIIILNQGVEEEEDCVEGDGRGSGAVGH